MRDASKLTFFESLRSLAGSSNSYLDQLQLSQQAKEKLNDGRSRLNDDEKNLFATLGIIGHAKSKQ